MRLRVTPTIVLLGMTLLSTHARALSDGGSDALDDSAYYQNMKPPGSPDSPSPSSPRSRGYRSEYRTRSSGDEYSALDEVRIHAGVGLINSLQQLPLDDSGSMATAGVRGMQANFGIDLFSPHWIAEGSILNFPEMRQDHFNVASNAFELKLLYTGAILEGVTLQGGPGISSRNFTIKTDGTVKKDPLTGQDVAVAGQARGVSTANTVFSFGASYWISGNLSLGVEAAARLPLISTSDPQSTDFGIRVDGHF